MKPASFGVLPPTLYVKELKKKWVKPPLGHCYYFLCFSSPARVAFSENTPKKKKNFEIDQAAARSHSPLLASCMTRRLKTAQPTRIKGESLSGGGTDDENSEGELFEAPEFLGRSIKIEKDGLCDPLVCVGIFQAFDVRVNAQSSTKAGPIDDHSDFAPFAASSANTRESMEVELAMKWSQQGFFFAARVLARGKLSRLKAFQRRETRRGRGKRHMPSVE